MLGNDLFCCCTLLHESALCKKQNSFNCCMACSRLSYYQKIQEVCPPSYESVLPKKPVANFKFEQEGSGEC